MGPGQLAEPLHAQLLQVVRQSCCALASVRLRLKPHLHRRQRTWPLCHAPKLLAFISKRRQESRSVPDVPALLLAGFDVWPGPSAWARRVSEAVLASAGRYRVLTLSVRTGGLPHSEAVLGARALRVPVGTGPLLERV